MNYLNTIKNITSKNNLINLNKLYFNKSLSKFNFVYQPVLPKHKIKIDDTYYRQPHPVWDLDAAEEVKVTHLKPKSLGDRYAYYLIQFCRKSFDIITRYDPKNMSESKYLTRAIFLETIAGVPGMIGGMHRHMRSLRGLKEDGGWIHHLLEEAENERMHLLTFLNIKQPGIMLRLSILASQYVFILFYGVHYILSPRISHRMVGYLEEEAVKTYTQIINDIDADKLPRWTNMPITKDVKKYWELPQDATMRDLIIAIRADEVNHREYNHYFSELGKDEPIMKHSVIEVSKENTDNRHNKEKVIDITDKI